MSEGIKDGLILEVNTQGPDLSYQDGLILEVNSVRPNLSHQDGTILEVIHFPDMIAPIITLVGDNPMSVEHNSTFTDPGATATDNISGDLTPVIVSGVVDTSTAGTYTLTYNISDPAGNAATPVARVIQVLPPYDKGDKPPLLESNFIINTHKLVNHESATSLRRAIPFVGSSKISSNIRKSESIYAREDRDIREVKEGIKLKDRQPEIYKLKHNLTEATINSKHTKVKLQEALRNKDRKIIYHDIKASLSFSEAILTQISNKLEELSYLTKTTAIKTAIKTGLAAIDVDPPSGSPSVEDQVAAIVSAA